MNTQTAIKLLKLYRELNPHRHDFGTAIDTVLSELGTLNKRIEYALDFAIDYDGEYNPETKQGNVEGLAMTIDDMVDALKGRIKGLEGEE